MKKLLLATLVASFASSAFAGNVHESEHKINASKELEKMCAVVENVSTINDIGFSDRDFSGAPASFSIIANYDSSVEASMDDNRLSLDNSPITDKELDWVLTSNGVSDEEEIKFESLAQSVNELTVYPVVNASYKDFRAGTLQASGTLTIKCD